MKPCSILLVSAISLLGACGSSDEPRGEVAADFDGVYRPVSAGPIASITFSAAKSYLLMPSGCAGRGCAELGTYRLEGDALILSEASTGTSRTIAVEILASTAVPSGTSLVKTLRPMGDLIDPGTQLANPGEQLTNGNGQQLANPGGQLTDGKGQELAKAGQQLLQLIQQAMMNGQEMKREGEQQQQQQQPQPQEPPRARECAVGVPTAATPKAEADAYWARCPNGP